MGSPDRQTVTGAISHTMDATALRSGLERVREDMHRLAHAHMPTGLNAARRASAANLLHYLALRRVDLRDVYRPLKARGLSSLGRAERHAMDNVSAVLRLLGASGAPSAEVHVNFDDATEALIANTDALFGPAPKDRAVRVMVTMPSEAASHPPLVRELLDAGMDVMRINCAHDDENAWAAMIEHLATARHATGRACKVMMDLAGPKVRTGAMAPGPPILRWRPVRDEYGRVISPARLWLTGADAPAPCPEPLRPGDAVLRVPATALGALAAGDSIRLRDARARRTRIRVTGAGSGGLWAECDSTAYIEPATPLYPVGGSPFRVQAIPPIPQVITLHVGEQFTLSADQAPGEPESRNTVGAVVRAACIPFTLPEVFAWCAPGQPVWLDDGKIGCVIVHVAPGALRLRVTHAAPSGSVLGPDKGINLPETPINLPALTPKDERDLAFIARHADIVAYSFVRSPAHVAELQSRLSALGQPDLGVVLKIETRRAFECLPAMLLQLLNSRRAGVMIARGDLAVECGYERLAEVQEEILWVCEAAHVPVIWATQVLDRLAKKGQPTRAEITDAAMSSRAECVMLNKGPYIGRAMAALDDILKRMQAHHTKKSQVLRPLGLARGFGASKSTG